MNRYLLYALAACAVAIVYGWSHMKEQAKELATATDRITTLSAAAESRRNTQKLLAQLDTEHTKALTDAQAQNKALLARIGTGAQRLSAPARCPAVGATSATTGLDDAEARAELDPASAQRIVAIPGDGDDAIRALTALQDWVTTACLGATNQ